MEKYNLTQTGEEVQQILDNATPQSELTAEVERAQGAEQTLQGNIDAEELRAKAAEQQNADDIDAIEAVIPNDASSNNKLVTESDLNSEVGDLEQADTVLQGNIEAEELRAKAAEKQNADDIDVIEEKIPTEASSSNQLADKAFVNSSIASNTATYRGSFNQVNDLHLTLEATEADIATALASAIDDADNNDYCYLQVPVSESAPTEIAQVDRYKFNGTTWAYEYTLNNSGFTADQWAALNSAITSGLVAKLSALPNMTELTALLAGKQDLLNFDNTPTTGSNNPVTSSGVKTAIDNEKTRAQAAEQANNLLITQINGKIPSDATSENKLVDKAYVDAADATMQSAIEGILALIPEAATALNQLADKAFVNSSIATNTGTFKGTYNVVLDLELFYDATQEQIALMLASKITSAKNNDYCYVQVPNSNENPTSINHTDRYKYNGTAWAYEYTLNNSGYTSDQWGAINSGITSALVTSLTNLLNNLVPSTATEQNKLADQAYVIAAIVAAIPACKGTFTTLSDLEAVASPKAGDLGIVRTSGTDGYPVFSFYQYLNNTWNLFFALDNYYQLNKPAAADTSLALIDNGMGKYEIPKHIVNIGTELEPIYQNQLHQSDFQINGAARTNTIYVIKYDFTLAEDITIPANCVLEFDGGSITGEHTITGTNTGIQASLVKIFSTDVTLAGTWNVAEAYPEWFGAVGNGSTDDSDAIQLAINTFNKIVFLHNYKVTRGIEVNSNRTLVGIGKPIIYQYSDTAILLNKNRDNNTIDKNISICNIVFDSSNVVSTDLNKNRAISFVGVADVSISGCEFLENKSDAIRFGVENNNVYKHNTNVSILDCLFQNYKRQGIAFSDCSNFRIISCNFINTNTDAYAIDYEPSAEEGSFATGYGVVKECTIKGFGINVVRSFQKISIQNCIIDTSAINSFGFAAQSSFNGDIEINNNIFIGNTTYNYVVQSSSTGKTFIERNKISGGKDACINLSGAYSVISKNDIDAYKFGINIRNAGTHKVLDNIISAPNNEPIKVFNGASNNTISHNSISGKENIEVLSTGYSVIDSNHITISNTTYSIIVSSATNIIVNNVLNKNINETTQGSVVANNIITS